MLMPAPQGGPYVACSLLSLVFLACQVFGLLRFLLF
jgi:hypothetical protein